VGASDSYQVGHRIIVKTHYDELSVFVKSRMGKDKCSAPPARASACKLTRQQFRELSTDVYDDLVRRKKATRLRTKVGPEPP
jgi:hypothetical protein